MGESDITLDRHVRNRILAAGKHVIRRARIYLDTNFWVWLRKASEGRGDPASNKLLEALTSGADSGRLICPLSESAFMELFKQEDLVSRRATAVLMARLSGSYALIDPRTRMANEVANFFHRKLGADVYGVDELAWGRVSYALGIMHPYQDIQMPADLLLALQKGVFDEIWNTDLVTMVDQIGSSSPPPDDMATLADTLNRGNSEHAHELRSFPQTYRMELRGVAEQFAPIVLEVAEEVERRTGKWPADERFTPSQSATNFAINALLFALEKDESRDSLRSLHIEAALHASIRWDKKRKLVANDLYDFKHASAALGYCNMFFTERPLRALIEQKHLALDTRFSCAVCANPSEALALLAERGLA